MAVSTVFYLKSSLAIRLIPHLRRLIAVNQILVAQTEHHQQRPPPVHRLMGQLTLHFSTAHHGQQGVEPLTLMEQFFLTYADHGPAGA